RRHPGSGGDLVRADRHPAGRAAGRLSPRRQGPFRTERTAGAVPGTHPLPPGAGEGRGTTTKAARRGGTVVTGSDNAGYGHKSARKELLQDDPRVDEVIAVGVTGREDGTCYPIVAVEAAEKVAAGEVDRALLVCGTGLG